MADYDDRTSMPRSSRVFVNAPPIPIPARSPLRPLPTRISFASISSQDSPPDTANTSTDDDDEEEEDMMKQRSQSPQSLIAEDDHDHPSSSSPPLPPNPPPTATLTKRQHALHELLSSERAYASDLALIREYHIPLALGQTPPLTNLPVSPPNSSSSGSSNSSSRTMSTASDSSVPSNNGPPPMSPEDVKIIFGNVAELAMFSDLFSEELELALGAVVEGGQGEDRVGELFLRIIPQLEKPFKQYITRHPTALSHLQNLPQTPELTAYLAYTQTVASSLSHAWDIASLLIKPVQRLLKYPLLLGAIIDETPDIHPDKENLRLARARMEEVARNVNEGRRRAEVVKDVLSATKGSKKGPAMGVGVAAGVNLSKMKSLRHGGVTAATVKADLAAAAASSANLGDGDPAGSAAAVSHHEAAKVEALQAELKRVDIFAQQFAKNVVDYSKMMSNVMIALRHWSLSFGRVIGLSAEQGSEAFDAFLEVVETQLMPLAVDLERSINERILKQTAFLLNTMTQPLKLLASMNEQEPFHYHLLTMPVSAKNRPPQSLLAASNNYLALRGQLAAELPDYLRLLNAGFAVVVRQLADIQKQFWNDIRDRWGELWEMLRVEGEWNAGWEETVGVWSIRWRDVDEVIRMLGVTRPIPPTVNNGKRRTSVDHMGMPSLQNPAFYVYGFPPQSSNSLPQEEYNDKKLEKKQSTRKTSTSSSQPPAPNVSTGHSTFPAPEPAHSPRRQPPAPVNLAQTLGSPEPSGGMSTPSLGGHSPSFPRVFPTGSGSSPPALSGGSSPGHRAERERDRDREIYGSYTTSEMMAGAMYSVSSPLPLQPLTRKSGDRDRDREKGKGRVSDAAQTVNSANGWNANASSPSLGSGGLSRRSSQDSLRNAKPRRKPSERDWERNRDQDRDKDRSKRKAYIHPDEEYAGHEGVHYTHGSNNGHVSARQSIPRTKSMPLSSQVSQSTTILSMREHRGSDKASVLTTTAATGAGGHFGVGERERGPESLPLVNGGGYVVDGDHVYYQPPAGEREEDHWATYMQQQQEAQQGRGVKDREEDKVRGRQSRTRARSGTKTNGTSPKNKPSPSPKPKSKERPTHARKRSGSVKSITSFLTSNFSNSNANESRSTSASTAAPSLSTSQRDSWVSKPAKYVCQVIHPCRPPAAVSYYSFPFFTLLEGDFYEVLQEAGHPSIHPKLPLYVDDGEDCLLLCRDGRGVVGWALASFLEPVGLDLGP